jgi:hypothetical protein
MKTALPRGLLQWRKAVGYNKPLPLHVAGFTKIVWQSSAVGGSS